MTYASKSSVGPSYAASGLYEWRYYVNCVMVLSWFYQHEMSDATMSTVWWFCHGSIIDESAEENVLKNEKNENWHKTKKAPLTGGA